MSHKRNYPEHQYLCWDKHISCSFQKAFPSSKMVKIGKKCLHGMCHGTQSRHVQDCVVLSRFEANETLWSSPLELVPFLIIINNMHINLSVLRDFDRLSKQWMMTDRGFQWSIQVQWTCRSNIGLTVCNSGRDISDMHQGECSQPGEYIYIIYSYGW